MSAHESQRILNLRIQKALGTEFLVFADPGNRKVFIVDINSLNTDPADPASVNREINNKKITVPIAVNNPIELTETAGNDNVLAIAWTEEKQMGVAYDVTLVAVTRQAGNFNFVRCPNGSHSIAASKVREIKVFIKNNEPKILDIHTRGDKFILDAFGH